MAMMLGQPVHHFGSRVKYPAKSSVYWDESWCSYLQSLEDELLCAGDAQNFPLVSPLGQNLHSASTILQFLLEELVQKNSI